MLVAYIDLDSHTTTAHAYAMRPFSPTALTQSSPPPLSPTQMGHDSPLPRICMLLVALIALCMPHPSMAVPSNFAVTTIATGFNFNSNALPTKWAHLPDGRVLLLQQSCVFRIASGSLPLSFSNLFTIPSCQDAGEIG